MKMTANDRKIALQEKNKPTRRRVDPDSIRQKCLHMGVNPGTIRSRMARYGLTFEEAVEYRPRTPSERSAGNSKRSPWRNDMVIPTDKK